jgi:hypothetical protein
MYRESQYLKLFKTHHLIVIIIYHFSNHRLSNRGVNALHYPVTIKSLNQSFSNCGTPATVQWYTRIIRKNQGIKDIKRSSNKCSYIENLIKMFF